MEPNTILLVHRYRPRTVVVCPGRPERAVTARSPLPDVHGAEGNRTRTLKAHSLKTRNCPVGCDCGNGAKVLDLSSSRSDKDSTNVEVGGENGEIVANRCRWVVDLRA